MKQMRRDIIRISFKQYWCVSPPHALNILNFTVVDHLTGMCYTISQTLDIRAGVSFSFSSCLFSFLVLLLIFPGIVFHITCNNPCVSFFFPWEIQMKPCTFHKTCHTTIPTLCWDLGVSKSQFVYGTVLQVWSMVLGEVIPYYSILYYTIFMNIITKHAYFLF